MQDIRSNKTERKAVTEKVIYAEKTLHMPDSPELDFQTSNVKVGDYLDKGWKNRIKHLRKKNGSLEVPFLHTTLYHVLTEY